MAITSPTTPSVLQGLPRRTLSMPVETTLDLWYLAVGPAKAIAHRFDMERGVQDTLMNEMLKILSQAPVTMCPRTKTREIRFPAYAIHLQEADGNFHDIYSPAIYFCVKPRQESENGSH